MELKEFYFDQAVFELRFRDGYKVLDVPGEILRRWASKFDPNFEWGPDGLRLQRSGDSFKFEASIKRLLFTMNEVSTFDYFRDHVCPIAEDVVSLLEIREPERAGVRFFLVFPIDDPGKAVERMRKTAFRLPDNVWSTLGDKYIGVSLALKCGTGGVQRRLAISTAERVEDATKKGPERGIMVDFDYSAHEKLTSLLMRSFLNDGFASLREYILPLCDSILRE